MERINLGDETGMKTPGKYLVLYAQGGIRYKICRILFGADGSYYVTAPYHPEKKAIAFKATVNYRLQEMDIPFEELLDSAALDDDDQALKLSHHPDGFIQFSGSGVRSGKDEQGNIKGIGVMSWPLDRPVGGPAFGLVVRSLEGFDQEAKERKDVVAFEESEVTALPEPRQYHLEGHYFTDVWRRFIRTDPLGRRVISVLHPAGAILTLRVLLPRQSAERQGFLGIEFYTMPKDEELEGGFFLSSSTGNLRRNDQGDILGDGVFCMFPRLNIPIRRTINWSRPDVEGFEG